MFLVNIPRIFSKVSCREKIIAKHLKIKNTFFDLLMKTLSIFSLKKILTLPLLDQLLQVLPLIICFIISPILRILERYSAMLIFLDILKSKTYYL